MKLGLDQQLPPRHFVIKIDQYTEPQCLITRLKLANYVKNKTMSIERENKMADLGSDTRVNKTVPPAGTGALTKEADVNQLYTATIKHCTLFT